MQVLWYYYFSATITTRNVSIRNACCFECQLANKQSEYLKTRCWPTIRSEGKPWNDQSETILKWKMPSIYLPISRCRFSKGYQWQDTKEGVLHEKGGFESFRQMFLKSIVSANVTGLRTDKLKPYPLNLKKWKPQCFIESYPCIVWT